MSLISEALWRTAFPDKLMPKGCTYWQFAAMRDVIWAEEDKEWSVGYIKQLEELKRIHKDYPNIVQELEGLIREERKKL